ncbi:MAG TPA: hypothetical protein VKA46_25300 [Gemmataceae bacterium]|nr:hypothetical protein [Gemmataceae bacterium]
MSTAREAVEGFGQGTDFTCAVACARYLLHREGVECTEADFCRRLGPYLRPGLVPQDGYDDDQVGRVLEDFGLLPEVRCLTGVGGDFELLQRPPREGTAPALWDWLLRTTSSGRPVKVCLDMTRLADPSAVAPRVPHSVVVLTVRDGLVYYLEPDPPGQVSYPKRGEVHSAPLSHFRAAWQALSCLALAVEPLPFWRRFLRRLGLA